MNVPNSAYGNSEIRSAGISDLFQKPPYNFTILSHSDSDAIANLLPIMDMLSWQNQTCMIIMQAALPDVARLQFTSDSLNVILKNTHFKYDILAPGSNIRFRINNRTNLPVLVFNFPESYYDFLQILSFTPPGNSNMEWLDKSLVVIKLVISDTVITDRLSFRSFALDYDESEKLRGNLNAQKELHASQIQETEAYIYANVNEFFLR